MIRKRIISLISSTNQRDATSMVTIVLECVPRMEGCIWLLDLDRLDYCLSEQKTASALALYIKEGKKLPYIMFVFIIGIDPTIPL